jgi:hypothetical protein
MGFLVTACGYLPHDLERRPVGKSVPGGGADATVNLSPAGFIEQWHVFAAGLAQSPQGINFNGSMVVLAPGATAPAIARMTRELQELRRVWSDYYETRFIDVVRAKAALDEANARQRTLRRAVQARPENISLQIAAAGLWWTGHVERLAIAGVVDPAGGVQHAVNVFENYCEAKLWELATSPHMLAGGFPVRPQAFGPCDSYYAGKGYFSGLVCALAARDHDSRGGAYVPGAWFDCIWHEGIMAGQILARRFSADKAQAIGTMLREGWLQAALGAADRSADARASIMGLKRARKKTFARFDGDPLEESLRDLFVPDLQPPGALAAVTPRVLLDFIEEQPRSQAQLQPELAFFPRAVTDPSAFNAEREAHAAIANLGKRDFVHFMSVGDFLWNGLSLSMPWSEWIDAAESHPWLEPLLSTAAPEDVLAIIEARAVRLSAMQALKEVQEREASVDLIFSAQAARALAASVDRDSVQAFWPEVQLTLRKNPVGEGMVAGFAFSRDVPVRDVIVGDNAPSGETDFAAWLDRESGSLKIRLSAGAVQAQAFGQRLSPPDDVDARTRGFNDIPPGFDETTSFEASLYLGRMGRAGQTPVISGRTVFRTTGDPGIQLYLEGEVSFLRL